MRKKRTHTSAHTFKDNFWSKLRVEQNIKIKEIVEYLKLQGILKCESSIGMFFSGQQLPKQIVSDAICEMFNVDKTTGYLEFQHAHREWRAEHEGKTLVVSAKKPYVPKRKKIEPKTVTEVAEVVAPLKVPVVKSLDDTKDTICRLLYNKVDYDTYCVIKKILDEELK